MEEVLMQALSHYGLREIPGERHNPHIIEYSRVAGHKWVQTDELAWCSAFVNWCAITAGYEATRKLNARSWLDIGLEVATPEIGDLVILWRVKKNSAYGHVGFFISEMNGYINILGGNQNNMVKISSYPKYRLLGYRRLQKVKAEVEENFYLDD